MSDDLTISYMQGAADERARWKEMCLKAAHKSIEDRRDFLCQIQEDQITALEAENARLQEVVRLYETEIDRLERVEETRNTTISRVEAEVKKVQAISDQLADRLFSDITTLKADKAKLVEALKPLAAIDCVISKPDEPIACAFDAWHSSRVVFNIGSERTITVGDLRNAARLLKEVV